MKKDELKKLGDSELKKELSQLRRELFDLKMTADTGDVKDFSQFRKIRKNIARCQTYLRQRNS